MMKTYKLTVLAAVLSLGLVQCTNTHDLSPKEANKEGGEVEEVQKDSETADKEDNETETPEAGDPNLLEGNDAIINVLRGYAIPKDMLRSDERTGKKVLKSEIEPLDGKPVDKGGILTDPNTGGGTGIGYDDGKELEGVKLYRNRKKKEEATYSEPLITATYLESVYPGMVLKSDQLSNGAFATVGEYAVNPIRVSGSWLAQQGTDTTPLKSKVLENPSTSEYNDWRLDVFSAYPEEGSVSTTVDITEIDLSHEGGVSAGYQAKTLMDLGFKIDLNAGKYKSYVLARFVQKLYTVSMDIPKSGLLHNLNTSDLNGFKPVYVSDIHYGRICYALFSSDALSVDLRASIEAMQKMIFGMSQGGDGSFNYSYIFDKSEVQFMIIGGNQNTHAAALSSKSGDNFKRIISEPIDIRNAAPIAINLRFVDDNARARVFQANEMPLQEAIFIPYKQSKLEFGAQITDIKAQYGALKTANIAGEVSIKVPTATGHTTLRLLDNGKKNPIVIETGDKYQDVRAKTGKASSYVLLTSFMNKDKPGYFDEPVEIHVKLAFTGKAGVTEGKQLIETTIKKPLRDFIFDCKDGFLDVEVDGLGSTKEIKYNVKLHIELDPVTKEYE